MSRQFHVLCHFDTNKIEGRNNPEIFDSSTPDIHKLQAQSRGHHAIDRLEEEGVEIEKRSTIFLFRRTLELFQTQRQCWENFSERRDRVHADFSEPVYTILN